MDLRSPLESNPERLILDAARKGQIVLVVPEIVIREAMTKWMEGAIAQLDKTRGQMEKLAKYGMAAEMADRQAVGERRADVEAGIRDTLAAVGARIPGFPSVPHEVIVQRALDRRQPFDSRGKDGYRDVVLWHVVLDPAAGSEVALVSNDGRAFGDGEDGQRLAPGLREEVLEARGDADRVRLVRNLRELTDNLAEVDQATLAKVEELVREQSFRTLLEEALEDEVPGLELDMEALVDLNLGVPIEYAFVAGLEAPGTVTPRRAYTLPSGEALVDLDALTGLRVAVTFHDRSFAQAFRNDPDLWLSEAGQEWEDLLPGEAVTLATTRLAHLRAEVSITLPCRTSRARPRSRRHDRERTRAVRGAGDRQRLRVSRSSTAGPLGLYASGLSGRRMIVRLGRRTRRSGERPPTRLQPFECAQPLDVLLGALERRSADAPDEKAVNEHVSGLLESTARLAPQHGHAGHGH